MPEEVPDTIASSAPPAEPGSRLPRKLSPTLRERPGYLIAQAHLTMHTAAAEAIRHLGLTVKHYACLVMIGEASGPSGVSQATLVEQSNIDRSTMVAIIDDLERSGYVVRTRNPADRRAYALAVTDEGRDWVAEVQAAIRQMEAEQLAALSPAERERLLMLLQRLLEGEPA
jgi:MarR family transcriptional regulator, lower aerobic nicotinate degradation pathway regulator